MGRVVLVTGTDTGVGKTVVTAAMARSLRAFGVGVVAVKAIESGCDPTPSPGEDGARLAQAAHQARPRHALRRFRAPIAPAEAAELEGAPVELRALVRELRALAPAAGITLVEGAGGLLSPLAWDWGHLELAHALEAEVLLVASDRLGCVNHVLLSLQAIRHAGRPVTGLVMSAPAVPDPSTGANPATIARLEPGLAIAELGRVPPGELESVRLDEAARWMLA